MSAAFWALGSHVSALWAGTEDITHALLQGWKCLISAVMSPGDKVWLTAMHGRGTQASPRCDRRDMPDKEHKSVAVKLPLLPEGLFWGSVLLKIIIKLHTRVGVL